MIKIKALVLVGGYGTRLYPLTKDKPKALLEVAGKPILEHIIEKIAETSVSRITIVSNDKFAKHFEAWQGSFSSDIPIEVLNDGTRTNEDRLGAIGDIAFAIKQKNIDDDLLVIAGDNLFEASLKNCLEKFSGRNGILLYDVKDRELAKQYGVVAVENDIVTHFEEKPLEPKSTLISTGIYFFPKQTLSLITQYLEEGNNPDKSGSFIEWLYKREVVAAFSTEKPWYDIGSHQQLEAANSEYKG